MWLIARYSLRVWLTVPLSPQTTPGPRSAAIRADVSNLPDLDARFDQVNTASGQMDVLVANAGGSEAAPLSQIPIPGPW